MATFTRVSNNQASLIFEQTIQYTGPIPPRTSSTADLMALLPSYFDTEPDEVPMLTISPTVGTFDVRVAGSLLEISPSDTNTYPFACDLRDFTLNELTTTLKKSGFNATVPEEWNQMAATILIDDFQGGKTSVTLSAFTSTLWRIIRPLALCFDMWSDDLDMSLTQMDIRTASGRWLDWWGNLYGVARLNFETDAHYRKRIVWEVMAPRANNVALEAILKEVLGYDARVTDGLNAFYTWYDTWSGTYNSTTWSWTTDNPEVLTWGLTRNGVPAGFVADPSTAPSLAANSSGSTFAGGTQYYVKYSHANASGETRTSLHSTVTPTAGQHVVATVPALPVNATSTKVYIGSDTQAFKLAGSTVTTTLDIDTPPSGGGNDADVAVNTTASGTATYSEPTYQARFFPGSPGQFNVSISQVIENDTLGVAELTELINRYKAAGFIFTLSIATFYQEIFDMGVETKESYSEDVSEGWGDGIGQWQIFSTMASQWGEYPFPMVWESTCKEEWSQDGIEFTLGGDTRILSLRFDSAGQFTLGFPVSDEIVRVAPPGIILVG